MISSDWYRKRLEAKRTVDIRLWERHLGYLNAYLAGNRNNQLTERIDLAQRIDQVRSRLAYLKSPEYENRIESTIGVDPFLVYTES